MGSHEPWSRGIELALTFFNRAGPQRLLGPLAALRVDATRTFYSLEALGRALVQFEDGDARSALFGPFAQFTIVDRLACADGRAFALYKPAAGAWLAYDTGRCWPSLVIFAPRAASGPAS